MAGGNRPYGWPDPICRGVKPGPPGRGWGRADLLALQWHFPKFVELKFGNSRQ